MLDKNSELYNLGASLAALLDSLKLIHPADIRSGVKALTQFMEKNMVGDVWYTYSVKHDYQSLLEAGRVILALNQQAESDLASDLADYSKLAGAVHSWIFTFREIEESEDRDLDGLLFHCLEEISRIGDNLGFEVFDFDSHQGMQPISIDPIEKYLYETNVEQIIGRKGEAESAGQDKLPVMRNTGNRAALYDKCVALSARLQSICTYATSHLAIAVQASRDLLLECGDVATVREQKTAKQLWGNLRESLLVAERDFRQ